MTTPNAVATYTETPKEGFVTQCVGTKVQSVEGVVKNVPCPDPATTTRQLPQEKAKGTCRHYCEACARDWDEQQKLISQLVGI